MTFVVMPSCDEGEYVVLPLRILGTHNRAESVLFFEPCAECDSAVTRANVLKTHNESKLAEIKRCAVRACLHGVDGCGSPLSPVTVSSSAVVHSPCAECDSSVTRVDVLKTHNESRLAKIRRCAVHACLPGVGGCGSPLPPVAVSSSAVVPPTCRVRPAVCRP